jgi:hypothetical protein
VSAPVLPKCRGCGNRTDRVVSLRDSPLDIARHVWECANCEYLRLNPDAKRGISYPREMPKAKLQKETLLAEAEHFEHFARFGESYKTKPRQR